LGKEPLLEAVCELRVSPTGALHTVLPGYLYASFRDQVTSLEQLPAGAIPDALRAQDPNLAYASVVRLGWREYFILIGPRSVAIACRLPYPKWPRFKADTLELFRSVIASALIKGIDRYSVKYINFFPSADGRSGNTEMLDFAVRIGEFSVDKEATQLRVEIPDGDVITVVTLMSPAEVAHPTDPVRTGGIVDVDTICNHVTNDLSVFERELEGRLDHIRLVNKRAFFDCLKQSAIDEMEPTYDASEPLSRALH
jgi:uncharacterized protein (TIGR04255 family)